MFEKTKSARKWLAKYHAINADELPADLRRKLMYFKAAQAFTIVSIAVGLFSYTVWMMWLGAFGAALLIFMRRAFEPALDRAIERHRRTTDMMLGTGDAAGATPLERAQAKYLALPEGDPRLELALKEYKAELEKSRAAAANPPSAPTAPAVAATPAQAAAPAVAASAPATASLEDMVAVMEAAQARYLSMPDDDPAAEQALQKYLTAMKRVKAMQQGDTPQDMPAQPAAVPTVAEQPVAPPVAPPPPVPPPPTPPVPEVDAETAMKIAEAKYLALKDGDPGLDRALREYVAAKERYEQSGV